MKIIKLFVLTSMLSMLIACTSINSKITATSNINPDINNTPSPVAISIFELSDPLRFQAADFFSLYSNAKNALGLTLLYEKNIVIAPGQSMNVSVPYVKGARFIGYIAAFRNLTNITWRGWVMINPTPVLGQDIQVILDSKGLHVLAVQRSTH